MFKENRISKKKKVFFLVMMIKRKVMNYEYQRQYQRQISETKPTKVLYLVRSPSGKERLTNQYKIITLLAGSMEI